MFLSLKKHKITSNEAAVVEGSNGFPSAFNKVPFVAKSQSPIFLGEGWLVFPTLVPVSEASKISNSHILGANH